MQETADLLREQIENFSTLLKEKKGALASSVILRSELDSIPQGRRGRNRISETQELLALVRLRIECYKIAGSDKRLKEFLEAQALSSITSAGTSQN